MAVLNESSRRGLTLLIFFLFGPLLLVFISFQLFSRNTPNSLRLEEKKLSTLINYDVKIGKREFLRPGAQRLLQTSCSTHISQETILFCPEIYIITENDPNFIRKITSTIDSYAIDKDFEFESESDNDVNFKSTVQIGQNQTFNNATVSVPKASLETLLFAPSQDDENSDLFSNQQVAFDQYTLVVIPNLFCKKSQVLDLKTDFTNLFNQASKILGFPQDSSLVVCFAFGKIDIQKEEEFELAVQNSQSSPPVRKSNSELAAFFKDNKLTPIEDSEVLSSAVLENKIRTFEAESPSLENGRALYISNSHNKRIDAVFGLKRVVDTAPYYLSFESFEDRSKYRLDFKTGETPIPSSFVSEFIPFFETFGQTSWFKGQLRLESFSSEKAYFQNRATNTIDPVNDSLTADNQTLSQTLPYWIVSLHDISLCNCNLSSLSAQINLPQFQGTITDLTISSGIIKQGVLEGTGYINVKDGSIPSYVLNKLATTNFVEVVPQKILKLRFLNDAIPFDELSLSFDITQSGMILDSTYRNKIVACYDRGNVQYGVFLPEQTCGKTISYARVLQIFIDYENDEFWSPLLRSAINHLPVPGRTKKMFTTNE